GFTGACASDCFRRETQHADSFNRQAIGFWKRWSCTQTKQEALGNQWRVDFSRLFWGPALRFWEQLASHSNCWHSKASPGSSSATDSAPRTQPCWLAKSVSRNPEPRRLLLISALTRQYRHRSIKLAIRPTTPFFQQRRPRLSSATCTSASINAS